MLAVAAIAVVAVGLLLIANRDGGEDTSGRGGVTGPDFHSLVVDPANPDRVFVGGHQAVSVSIDGGRSWTEIESLRDADAMGWALVDDTVYVSGHPGLNRSSDGGRTFQRVNEGLPNTDVHAFGGTSDVLYGASPGAGVFASTSGTGDWEIRTAQDGQGFFGRMVVDPDDPQHLVAADAQAGVAESTDGGRSWQRLDTGLAAATWLSASPDLSVMVASGPVGAARSDDAGRTWRSLDLPEGATLVEIASADASDLYAGRHRGSRVEVWVSRDGGERWQRP